MADAPTRVQDRRARPAAGDSAPPGGLTPAQWEAARTDPEIIRRFDQLRWGPGLLRGADPPDGANRAAQNPSPRGAATNAAPDSARRRLRGAESGPDADATARGAGAEDCAQPRSRAAPELLRAARDAEHDAAQPCIYFIGSISRTGHGSFRVMPAKLTNHKGVVPAHLFAWALAEGIPDRDYLRSLLPDGSGRIELCHSCDEMSCTNRAHLRLDSQSANRKEAIARRHSGPLSDTRGPEGRARAIRAAILAGLAAGEDDAAILARVTAAQTLGVPLRPSLW